MLKQLRLSLRMLFKYRLYTAFALIGLSIAITSVWFIADYVQTAYQYDAFHHNQENIYRLSMEITAGGNTDHYATTGIPLGELMSKNYSGVEEHAILQFQEAIVRVNEEPFKETNFYNTNPQTLSVFTFDFITGDDKALSEPNSIVLSESLALKYFDHVDIIGRQLILNDNAYNVKGVFQDWPKNTHIQINALMPLEETDVNDPQSWFNLDQYTYVMVTPAIQQKDLNSNLDQLARETLSPLIEGSGLDIKFKSQPLREVYFSPGLVDDVKKGSLIYINALAMAGIFVLMIACLNFINLTLTRSTKRAKEISLKKILGISRKQLLLQSTLESIMMVLLVILVSTIMIFSLEKFYIAYTGFTALHLLGNGLFILLLLFLIFVSGLLGSTYSGIYLSLSSRLIPKEGYGIQVFKKLLLGVQYSIAAIVLVITLSIGRQLEFIKNKDLGFDKQEVLIVPLPESEEGSDKGIQLREQLKNLASIENASLIGWGALPGEENGKDLFEVREDGVRTEKVYNVYRIDEHYFDLLDIKIAKGRNFDADKISEKTNSVIINEALANTLKWDKPLGMEIWYGGERREVVGVIKNFHNKSLHNIIEPIIFIYDNDYVSNILIKTKPSEINIIKATWASFYPAMPFSVTYFDEFIGAMYEQEHQLSQLFSFFSIITLMLCGMGLFALFSLHVQQRNKEMSIRKVLGANYKDLLKSILKNYSLLVLLSIFAAIPIAWFFVSSWLAAFSFNAQVGFEVYFFSGFIILLTSFVVIAYHLIKVLNVNPVIALKSE